MGVAGRVAKPRVDFHYAHGPITRVAGYYAKDIVFGMAGVGPDDIDLTGSYDAFTFTTMLQLEDYGFCEKGEGGDYVSSGIIELGGGGPNNTSGGHLCEGYTHGMSMVIENVRQLRGQADDYCPERQTASTPTTTVRGGCRQVRDGQIAMNIGWAIAGHRQRTDHAAVVVSAPIAASRPDPVTYRGWPSRSTPTGPGTSRPRAEAG